MPVRGVVWPSFYQDSMVLMNVAARVRQLPGVLEAAVLMGTPANHDLVVSAGLATPDVKDAAPGDLMLVVYADTERAADEALAAARTLLDERRRARESEVRPRPRTLESALRRLPEASIAVISVPGAYAKLEALGALRRGLHVFLFSDNVPVEDEVELKRLARSRGLLCMGPDCGTAYLGGIALGFANVVPSGRIGCVAASGTGLQAVASRIAARGEGISHGIGVGGRDLAASVGGVMTTFALELLARDPATEAIVVISKPPSPSVLPALETAIGSVAKPVVVCCLGAAERRDGPGTWVATLEDAADAAVATVRGTAWAPRPFTDPGAVSARLAAVGPVRGHLLGLYTGGTLAHEARLLLEPVLSAIAGNVGVGASASGAHRILDLGADEFTVGRPHPMLDPAARDARVREAGTVGEAGVLLVDIVLGRAVHPDPASSLAAAVRQARAAAGRAGRNLLVIASVVGTERDPQGLRGQVAALEDAGIEVLPSNGQAARFAALALAPHRASALFRL